MNIYEHKNLTQKVVNMSSRQQVLFLLEQTMKEADWNVETQNGEDNNEIKQIIIRNENEEFEAMRKKQRREELEIKPERYRSLADSLHQFNPIKRNKLVDKELKMNRKELLDRMTQINKRTGDLKKPKKRLMVSEKDTYVCACQNQTRRKNKLTYPESGLTKDGKQHKLSFDCGERCINR